MPGTGAGPQAVKWTTTGWKVVTLTVSNGVCSTTFIDSVLVKNLAGIYEAATQAPTVKIMPNPNNGAFEILLDEPAMNPVTVKISAIDGRIVYNRLFNQANEKKISIATDGLLPGIYILNVLLDGALIREEITINK